MSRKRQNNEELPTASKKRHVSTEDNEESDDVEMVDPTSVRLQSKSMSVRSGKINKIILTNFMCHSNLVMDFNQNVNILIGNNGSGKSAILTALVVGLGSKSSTTNRCTNITQLIKRGETSSSVVIHISNNCDQAYDPGTYGPEIIVQRKFSSSGTSSYQTRKSFGQVVSSSRKDLMKILLFMNIQVDNPVCVLNQDTSREFLKDKMASSQIANFFKNAALRKLVIAESVVSGIVKCRHFSNRLDYENERQGYGSKYKFGPSAYNTCSRRYNPDGYKQNNSRHSGSHGQNKKPHYESGNRRY